MNILNNQNNIGMSWITMIAITENYEKSFNSDGSKIHQYQQNEYLSLYIIESIYQHIRIARFD